MAKQVLSPDEALAAEKELARRKREKVAKNKLATMFPDEGPCRRELYKRHVEFFKSGKLYKERLFCAGNRLGKSEAGCYELTCHLTGIYPHWWEGRRFDKPIEAWACGTNSETTRDIVQEKLLGPLTAHGTGMIPAHLIEKTIPRRGGIAGSIETIYVKHISGGTSIVGLKSYEQGRESFEGTAKEVVWLDEESPEDVYTECLFRTATTRGIVYTTFTPLKGMSQVVKGFIEPENPTASAKYKWYVQAGWKDVPHIPEEEKEALLATTPPYQIKARTEGEPALGSGAIYPIAESEITSNLMIIPESWPRAYGLDVGFNRTAAIWGARDPGSGIIYLYSEHYQAHAEIASHAYAIKSRGEWIPGVIDPAANGRSQIDGRQLLVEYRKLGLKIQPADNSVESGILEVWQLLVSGKLKVLAQCENFFREFRQYHRDDKGSGRIVKRTDHLMDACVVGSTQVITKDGLVEIASLVGKEGYVLSRSGVWARFIGARKTIENAETVKLEFEDGFEVICTPDHPFLTKNGWKKAGQMAGNSCYNGIAQRIQWHPSSYLQRFKSLKDYVTTFAVNTFNGLAKINDSRFVFTSGYGLSPMGVIPEMDTTSITRTIVGPITTPIICKKNSAQSIYRITQRESTKIYHQPPYLLPQSGIDPKRDWNGIASTLKSRIFGNIKNSFASNVALNSKPRITDETNSALTIARASGVVRLALTMKNALAWFVANLSWLIATAFSSVARENAVVNCVKVSENKRSDVYCLTVPGTSAFCLANGAVVHNTRYLIVSGRPRMMAPPKPPSRQVFTADSSPQGWMM